jgi:hypothetical protein
MGKCEAKLSSTSIVIGNVHKRLSLMDLGGIKTLKRTLKTLICVLWNDCNFYTLLEQSVYIKVVEYKKLNNFYIGGFSCNVEQIGVNCKKPHGHSYG